MSETSTSPSPHRLFLSWMAALDKIPVAGWMALSFLAWVIIFFPFFTGRHGVVSDAGSYFTSASSLVDALLKQWQMPLWDACYSNGVSFEFFLRRLGGYNPLYLLMCLFSAMGMPFTAAYPVGLSLYYFLGMTGFYLLAQQIYHDRRVAFAAFIVLLFSALGTRIFDSYMCLVTIPLIWFFYFVMAFLTTPRRLWLAGATLSAMILLNTYVPFFFITIVLFSSLFFIGTFWPALSEIIKRAAVFFKNHPVFSLTMAALLAVSLIPPVVFFMQASNNDIVLPLRQSGSAAVSAGAASSANPLQINTRNWDWGVLEDLFFSSYFTNPRRFTFAVAFFPLTAMILLLAGSLCRLNRRVLLYFGIGLFFVCLGSPLLTPLHGLLSKIFFFFKYFRNLHFFLWFILFPLLALLVAEIVYQFLNWPSLWKIPNSKSLWYIVMGLHVIVTVFLLVRNDLNIFTAAAIAGTLCSFYFLLKQPVLVRTGPFCLALCLMIIPQAANNYSCLIKNSPNACASISGACRIALGAAPSLSPDQDIPEHFSAGYYAGSGYARLLNNVSGKAVTKYLQSQVILYDRVEPLEEEPKSYNRLEVVFENDADVAFVPTDASLAPWQNARMQAHPWRDNNNAGRNNIKLKEATTNRFIFNVTTPVEKFLVFNTSFHHNWTVEINGAAAHLYRANVAFLGVLVPAGTSTVTFSFGTPAWQSFNTLLWLLFNGLFIGIVIAWMRARKTL